MPNKCNKPVATVVKYVAETKNPMNGLAVIQWLKDAELPDEGTLLAEHDPAQAREAAQWRALVELCGHLEDGSETTVTITQDDATRTAIMKVGKKQYCQDRCGIETALVLACADQGVQICTPQCTRGA